jgi:hypothetical protein
MRQRGLLSLCWFNIVLEFLARALRQRRNKRNTNLRGQTIPICRWHDLIPKRLEKLYQKNS